MKSVLIGFLISVLFSPVALAAPVHDAVRAGDLEQIIRVAKEYPSQLYARDWIGWAPLHMAAAHGYQEICEYLAGKLTREMLYVKNSEGKTPLHVAAFNGHAEVVRYLADKLPLKQLYAKDIYGNTPLHMAAESGHTEIVRFLKQEIYSRESLYELKNLISLYEIAPCKNNSVIEALVASIKNEENPIDLVKLIKVRLQHSHGCKNLGELLTGTCPQTNFKTFMRDRFNAAVPDRVIHFETHESKEAESS